MIINGEKLACQSCVKGHRVSNCNHHDRPLQIIAPKGRPIKQCEHCRDARKSNSHHAKCDCGSKRTKEKAKAESKSEGHSCCCHKGGKCVCGNKAEAADLRLETTLNRPTHPVISKPKLVSSNSESAVPVASGCPQRPQHRHNHSAHNAGQPYKISRPSTMHSSSSFSQHSRKSSVAQSCSLDDTVLPDGSSNPNLFGSAQGSQDSANSQLLDWDKLFGKGVEKSISISNDDQPSGSAADDAWYDATWLTPRPNTVDFTGSSEFHPALSCLDVNIPSAPIDFFSPSDLPLTSNPANPAYANYVQPISNSGESGFQSVPGMTTASSNAQSEMGENHVSSEYEVGNWPHGGAGMEPSLYARSNSSMPNGFNFSQQEPMKYRPTSHHSHTASLDTIASSQSDRNSDSATIVPTSTSPTGLETHHGINAGHLENLASLRESLQQSSLFSPDYSNLYSSAQVGSNYTMASGQTSSGDYNDESFAIAAARNFEFDQGSQQTSQAIIIPAGTDDDHENFSWSYSSATHTQYEEPQSTASSATANGSQHSMMGYEWLQ